MRSGKRLVKGSAHAWRYWRMAACSTTPWTHPTLEAFRSPLNIERRMENVLENVGGHAPSADCTVLAAKLLARHVAETMGQELSQ